MKIRFDIDCTPEEARRFLGLPDVSAVHADAMERVRQRVNQSLDEMEPQEVLRTWLPAGLENWKQLQDVFWRQFMGGGAGGPGGAGGSGGGAGGAGGTGGERGGPES
jgi:hypothetical protein